MVFISELIDKDSCSIAILSDKRNSFISYVQRRQKPFSPAKSVQIFVMTTSVRDKGQLKQKNIVFMSEFIDKDSRSIATNIRQAQQLHILRTAATKAIFTSKISSNFCNDDFCTR